MLRFKTSTGGTDLIAQFLSDKTGVNVGILIFIIDSFVILMGGYYYLMILFSFNHHDTCYRDDYKFFYKKSGTYLSSSGKQKTILNKLI